MTDQLIKATGLWRRRAARPDARLSWKAGPLRAHPKHHDENQRDKT